jgi:hypothetical protein
MLTVQVLLGPNGLSWFAYTMPKASKTGLLMRCAARAAAGEGSRDEREQEKFAKPDDHSN